MKILITGATGKLGQAVVNSALESGHQVRAMARPGRKLESINWFEKPGVEVARVDLRDRRSLPAVLEGVDVVVHLAAVLGGDFYEQFEGSVIATENLLAALEEKPSIKLVHISTFSVYGCLQRWPFAFWDEDSPREKHIDERDNYAKTKTIQENIIREASERIGFPLVVLRPGVIYGPGSWFPAQLGLEASKKTWIRIGTIAPVPITYVENCADAIILAAEKDQANGETFNIVDNNLPTQWKLMNRLRAHQPVRPKVIPIPWILMRMLGRSAWLFNKYVCKGNAKLPGLLTPAQLHARFKPFFYSNRKIRDKLGWVPKYSLDESLERIFKPVPQEAPTPVDVATTT